MISLCLKRLFSLSVAIFTLMVVFKNHSFAQGCNGVSMITAVINDDIAPGCSIDATFKVNGAIDEVNFILTLDDGATLTVPDPGASPARIPISSQGTYTETLFVQDGLCGNIVTSVTLNAYKKVNDVDPFCVGDLPVLLDFSAPLPVELVSFDARHNNGKVLLNWVTASEKNNDYFSIERSADGDRFYEIGTISGNGNSNEDLIYKYSDDHPNIGLNYYRLKQVDFDGMISFSDIKVIQLKSNENSFNIQNTLASNRLKITLQSEHNAKIPVTIFNLQGQPIIQKYLSNGDKELILDISYLPIGFYLINLNIEGNSTTKQWMKATF